MAHRTNRLGTFAGNVGSGGVVLFTCPTGRTAIAKDWTLQNTSAATASLRLLLRTSAGDVQVGEQSVGSNQAAQFSDRWVVVLPGEQLIAHCNPLNVTQKVQVSGVLLDGEPT